MLSVMQYVLIFILGLALGSFVNALVWRVHEQAHKKGAKSKDLSILTGRSMCPDCKHTLSAMDLIPVISWVGLRGKCRYCKKSISWQYPLVELLVAAALSVSFYVWPYVLSGALGYPLFIIWAMIIVLFAALTVYDLRWMLLPNRLIYPTGALTAGFVLLSSLILGSWQPITSGLIGALIAGGFFWLMYQISHGKWIGGGDVRLGFLLGLLLGWQQTLMALSLAAYLSLAVIIVIVLLGRYHKRMRLPFGPFLIVAAYISLLWGSYVIDWYLRLAGL